MNFIAKYDIEKSCIAAFATEKDRNDWVNFKDELSIDSNSSAENSAFNRMIATMEDIQSNTYYRIEKDEMLDNVTWFVPVA